jgi:hypothetical protein
MLVVKLSVTAQNRHGSVVGVTGGCEKSQTPETYKEEDKEGTEEKWSTGPPVALTDGH